MACGNGRFAKVANAQRAFWRAVQPMLAATSCASFNRSARFEERIEVRLPEPNQLACRFEGAQPTSAHHSL
jgi:hypothetical protein